MRRCILRLFVMMWAVLAIQNIAVAADYTDVPQRCWYRTAVEYVAEYGLMQGVGNGKFEPEGELSRGMFVTILGRIDGVDTSNYTECIFVDVSPRRYYAPYIQWAYEMGIAKGLTDRTFGPDEPVTREQMAVFVARYVNLHGIYLPELEEEQASFRDMDKTSKYAKDAVELMRKTGIIRGDTNGLFDPRGVCTRAQAATVFMRLHQAIPDGDYMIGNALANLYREVGGGEVVAVPYRTVVTFVEQVSDYWVKIQWNGETYYTGVDNLVESNMYQLPSGLTDEQRKLLELALAQLGKPYYTSQGDGKNHGPDSFDCSGFTAWCYRNALGIELSWDSRIQAADLRFEQVTQDQLEPGDIIFMNTGTAEADVVDHVVLYLGNGEFIHASSSWGMVTIMPLTGKYKESASNGGFYLGAIRILSASPELEPLGQVTVGRLKAKLYTAPSYDSTVVAELTGGTVCASYGTIGDTGSAWTYVFVQGKYGYLNSSMLKDDLKECTMYVGVRTANIRTAPTSETEANIAGKLLYDTPVVVLRMSGAWAQISYQGKIYYTMANNLTEQPETDISGEIIVSKNVSVWKRPESCEVGTDAYQDSFLAILHQGESVQYVCRLPNSGWWKIVWQDGFAYVYAPNAEKK